MTTHQEFGSFAADIERTVSVNGRTVRSHTRVRNTGRETLPIYWFPHPFYPHPDTDELCKLNLPICFPENPGYEQAPSGFIRRKGWPWQEGYYQLLDHDAAYPLIFIQSIRCSVRSLPLAATGLPSFPSETTTAHSTGNRFYSVPWQ